MNNQKTFKLLMKLGLSMVISMLINSLYNIVDSLFIAKISDDALNAISLIYPLQNIVMALAVGFGVGVASSISYYYGSKENDKMNNAASLGLLYGFIYSILTVVLLLITSWFLNLYTTNENVLKLGKEYAIMAFCFTIPNMLGITFEKIKETIKYTLLLTSLIMLIGTILSLSIPKLIMGLFSESPNIINLGSKALMIISIGFIVSAISITFCGTLEGLSKGVESLIISLLRYIIIIIPASLILIIQFKANGVFMAFPITEFISAFLAFFIYKFTFKKMTKINEEC